MAINAQSFIGGGGAGIPKFSDSNISSITERLMREKRIRDDMEIRQRNAEMREVKFADYIKDRERLEPINKANDINTLATAAAQANDIGIAKDMPQIVRNTNTEAADAVNDTYKTAYDAALGKSNAVDENGNKILDATGKAALDKSTKKLNDTYARMQNEGDLRLNEVSNNPQFASRIKQKMQGRSASPTLVNAYIKPYNDAASANDKTHAANVKVQGQLVKDNSDLLKEDNKNRGETGAIPDYMSNPEFKEVDNPWFVNTFDGWSKDKMGTINGADDYRIGKKEIGPALLDMSQTEFPTSVKRDKDGKVTEIISSERPTDKTLKKAMAYSFTKGAGGIFSDYYDADKFAEYVRFEALNGKDKEKKVSTKDIVKARTKAVTNITKPVNKGSKRIYDAIGLKSRQEKRAEEQKRQLAKQEALEKEQKAKAAMKP